MRKAPISTKERVAAVEPVVRRVLAAKVFDPHRLDDLVQETLARVASSRRELEGEALVAYAIVAARNVWASESARSARRGALQHRLADLRQPEQPEAVALRGAEHDALRAALRALSDAERRALVAHEVDGVATTALAEQDRSTPGAVAARLTRARAKLRVDYLLALRRVELPTDRCRGVLMALSAGDRRRQSALGAADHVLGCTTCADLVPALVERRLPLAVLVPAGAASAALRFVRRGVRDHPVQAGGAAGAAAAVAAAWMLVAAEPEPPVDSCAGLRGPDGQTVRARSLRDLSMAAVEARGAVVNSVPANEGFWVACGQARAWVRLVGAGESSRAVSPGAKLTFRGRVVPHGAGFAVAQGVEPAEGGTELDRQGFHVQVAYANLQG